VWVTGLPIIIVFDVSAYCEEKALFLLSGGLCTLHDVDVKLVGLVASWLSRHISLVPLSLISIFWMADELRSTLPREW
jgi:hypothetical protein